LFRARTSSRRPPSWRACTPSRETSGTYTGSSGQTERAQLQIRWVVEMDLAFIEGQLTSLVPCVDSERKRENGREKRNEREKK